MDLKLETYCNKTRKLEKKQTNERMKRSNGNQSRQRNYLKPASVRTRMNSNKPFEEESEPLTVISGLSLTKDKTLMTIWVHSTLLTQKRT